MNENEAVAGNSPVVPVVPVVRTDSPTDFVEPDEAVNPLLRAHVLLHGRYRYAIVLALILGVGGALAGYLLTPPKYEIVGYIRVKPYIPKVLYNTDQNGAMPSFDTYVNFQESLIQSQRVMDRAAQNPAWVALHHKPGADGTAPIATDSLVVDYERGTELITVTATDRDVNAAMAAVKSIIKAFIDISAETDNEGDAHRLQALEDLRTNLSNQQRAIHDQIMAIANEKGTDKLTEQYQLKSAEVSNLESELQEIALNLSLAEAAQNQPGDASAPSTRPVAPLTFEDVAAVDMRMRGYLAEEDQLSVKLAQLRTKLGEKNAEVLETQTTIDAVHKQMNDLLSVYQARGGVAGAPAAGRDRSRMSIAELRAQQTNIRGLYDKAQAEALDLGRKDLQIRNLKDEEDRITQRLNEASAHIDQLTLEGPLASRISVLSDGEKPTTPPKSKRTQMTAAGGVGGGFAGVALVALWGFADRRVRSVLQVQQLKSTVRLLGVLPILPESLSDPEQKLMAAHCVHQIRTLLDTGDHSHGRAIAITSPSAGDGKTSLTLSLGLSFAGAGYRTLLIDCDLVGGGLTGRLDATAQRGVGSILHATGKLTKSQLKDAHKISLATHRKLPEVLVELGYVSQADLDRAMLGEDGTSVGILNALNGDPVATCVTQVLSKGLFVLPLGDASAEHTSQVSPKAFRRILADAKSLFDVVIVDTGPLLGSLEASIVVREADEVVLAVAHNGSSVLVKRALALMESLGVGLAGLVFNRATADEVSFANYGSSSSHASSRSVRSRAREARHPSSAPRLGSLVAAVVSTSLNGESNTATNGASDAVSPGAENGKLNGSSNGQHQAYTNGGYTNGQQNGAPHGDTKEGNDEPSN